MRSCRAKANLPVSFLWTLEFQRKFRPSRRITGGGFSQKRLNITFPKDARCNYCKRCGQRRGNNGSRPEQDSRPAHSGKRGEVPGPRNCGFSIAQSVLNLCGQPLLSGSAHSPATSTTIVISTVFIDWAPAVVACGPGTSESAPTGPGFAALFYSEPVTGKMVKSDPARERVPALCGLSG
jgi:hypothetical protein